MPRQVSTPRTSEDGKLLLEATGARVPKGYEPVHGKHSDANKFETTMGREGHIFMASLDGQNDTLGVTDDAESASGNGTVVAILKRIRTLLGQVVLAAGTAIIGKVGIDQTTDGTTNRVVAKISQTAGENVVAVTSSALPTGASTLAKQDTIIGHVDGIETLIGTTNTNIGTTNTNIGATTDAESTTGNGTFIAILKRVRTLLTAVFEAIITPGAAIGTSKSIKVAGSDGTNVRDISTTSTGAVNVQLLGSIQTLVSAPATGQKTVTATAAELFAGVSVRANRRRLRIKNEDPFLRLRIGPSAVTQQNGFPVEPFSTVEFDFDPATPVVIFGTSEGAALTVSVWEE